MPEGGGLDHATPVVGAVVTAAHVRRRSLAGDDQLADATGHAMTRGAARRDTATPTNGRGPLMNVHICEPCAIVAVNDDNSHLTPTRARCAAAGLWALGMITLGEAVYVSHDRCAACGEVIYAEDAYTFESH